MLKNDKGNSHILLLISSVKQKFIYPVNVFSDLIFHPHSEMSAALFTTSGSTASLSLALFKRYSVRTLRVESEIPCNKKSNLQLELLNCSWATWQSRKKITICLGFFACCKSCKSSTFFWCKNFL